MRRIDPLLKEILLTLGAVSLVAICGALGFRSAYPDSGLMYTIAQIGTAIVFAYIIVAVWMVERVNRSEEDNRDWLGMMTGLAIAGLVGVGSALAVGSHRAAGHANFLDLLGLWWAVMSLVSLAAVIVIQPLLADIFREKAEAKSD
jgi:MFS family permease